MSSKNRLGSVISRRGPRRPPPMPPPKRIAPAKPALEREISTGSFDRPYCKPGDEAVEEEVVDDGDRHAGDQTGGHQRAPVVDVAADEGDRDADADGHLLDGGDERQAVDELLDDERQREDHDG